MLQELLIVFVVEVVVENKQPEAKATESDSSCLIRWEKYNVNSVDGVQYFLDVNKVEFKTETTLWQKKLKWALPLQPGFRQEERGWLLGQYVCPLELQINLREDYVKFYNHGEGPY